MPPGHTFLKMQNKCRLSLEDLIQGSMITLIVDWLIAQSVKKNTKARRWGCYLVLKEDRNSFRWKMYFISKLKSLKIFLIKKKKKHLISSLWMTVLASRIKGFLFRAYSALLALLLLEYPKISPWGCTELFKSFFWGVLGRWLYFILFLKLINLFLAALGHRCCMQAFSSCG